MSAEQFMLVIKMLAEKLLSLEEDKEYWANRTVKAEKQRDEMERTVSEQKQRILSLAVPTYKESLTEAQVRQAFSFFKHNPGGPGKIPAIMMVRRVLPQLGLKEAKDLVESI